MAKLIVSIEDGLHQAFRIKCLREHSTMKDKIAEFIKNDLGGILEVDEDTLQEFLAGKREIEQGDFMTLEGAKKKFKIK